jgi:hypothetical protein
VAILEKNVGLEFDRIQVKVAVDSLAQWTLRGHQAKDGAPVIPQNELRESRAEYAMTVENDDRAVVWKIGDRRVFPVGESLACHGIWRHGRAPDRYKPKHTSGGNVSE